MIPPLAAGLSPAGLGPQTLRALLEAALAVSEADETELIYTGVEEALTRFAQNSIHQNMAEADATLEVRAAVGMRVGAVTTNDLTPTGIERAVPAAAARARHLPENPDWPGLTEPQTYPDVLAFDEAAAALSQDPPARARRVADLCAQAQAAGLLASGALGAARYEYALLNSRGLFAYAPSTQVDVTFVAEQPDPAASAYAHATGWRLNQIDFEALRQETLRRAQIRQPRRHVPPGEYPVVLEPYAVLTVVEAMVEDGMGALAVQEGRSWMNACFGEPSMSPLITLVDDAFDPDGLPRAFDCEGVPKQRVPIIAAGVPTSPVYDRWTAAREPGKVSTGHAQPYADEDWDGPLPENLSLAAGDQSVENLIRSVERGLYIPRFWYVRQTSPHGAAATGTTRDGVWWIEGGELAYPAADLRFDQELVPALRGVIGVGRVRPALSGFCGVHRLPALALESFRFIDEADGEP
ncbi:MAG: TldD/PmbA family protein [Anaerolineales bacterium]|nr:TldD/PmbA family protein [Anaerolineales bacterium]